jgi:hypothetical protein
LMVTTVGDFFLGHIWPNNGQEGGTRE